MDLRELECFVIICEERNFTAAAERLYISQPAISKTLYKLEEELGLRLLNRNHKQVVVTTEGETLLKLAQDIIARFHAAQSIMEEYKNLKRGTFSIAVPPLTGAYVFPPLFAGFKKKYPALDMTITEEGSLVALDMVRKEELQAGIIILPSEDLPGVNSYLITRQNLVVCLPSDHRLVGSSSISLAELQGDPVILYNKGFALRALILNAYAERGLAPKIEISTNQFPTIKALVAKGAGISFLPAIAVDEKDAIVKVPLVPELHVDFGLIWNPASFLPPACKAFIEFVQNWGK